MSAIQKGATLSEFCKAEKFRPETILEHLEELRAIGVEGLNPFLPELKPGKKPTLLQQGHALNLIEAYVAKGGKLKKRARNLI